MTIHNRKTYEQYRTHDAAGTVYATAANRAIDSVMEIARDMGLKADNSDAAENLTAAIFAYIWDSNHK